MKYPNQEGATDAQNTRRKWLTILGVVVVIGLVVYGLYWLLYARHFEGTDDA
jgi:membrane fusion protein (multidrug efflux system)